jgi:bacillithiol biosynthesis cysteine-adding enzyme BshC
MTDTPASPAIQNLEHQLISYAETKRFSPLILDYLSSRPELRQLYDFEPNKDGLAQALESMKNYSWPRQELAEVLLEQWQANGKDQSSNDGLIETQIKLLSEDAYCTVTAHQLNLFTGPLYVVLKAAAAVQHARKLKELFPTEEFVPIFWMGSEDHDLDEINHFQVFGKRLEWETEQTGPTGQMSTEGLESVLEHLRPMLERSEHGEQLAALFEHCYLNSETLAEAQQKLLYALFAEEGLLVLDPDDARLKAVFAAKMQEEGLKQTAISQTQTAREHLESSWKVQAQPREINLFYHQAGYRARVEDQDGLQTVDGKYQWSEQSWLEAVESNPQDFSPNVIMRPLYQQMILPAVSFIGGGGEMAYWLELKDYFHAQEVFFPVLLLRPSVLWVDAGSEKRITKLGLGIEDMFEETEQLIKSWTQGQEDVSIDLSRERAALEKLYQQIAERAAEVDPALKGNVLAQAQGPLKALDKLEQKMTRSAKQRFEVEIGQIRKLLEKLFPASGLQERKENFSSFYAKHGQELISMFCSQLDPLDARFRIIREK